MNRVRSLVVASLFLITFAAYAAAGTTAKPEQQNAASAVDQHMQMLTARLDLTDDQQSKIKPVVQQMLESRQKLLDDKSLTDEQRHQKMHALHDEAISQVREYLTDEQNKKLDELNAEHEKQHKTQ